MKTTDKDWLPANLEFVAAAPARRPGWEEDEEDEDEDEEEGYGPGGFFDWPVQVKAGDDLKGLNSSVFEDPRNFIPVAGPEGVVVR